MGFFSDLWDGIKSVGSGIYNTVKNVGGKVLNVANKARDIIGKGLGFIGKVPIIGGLVNRALDAPVFDGLSARNIAGLADTGLDTANQIAGIGGAVEDAVGDISRGDFSGAANRAQDIFQRGRGVVDSARDVRSQGQDLMSRRRAILKYRR